MVEIYLGEVHQHFVHRCNSWFSPRSCTGYLVHLTYYEHTSIAVPDRGNIIKHGKIKEEQCIY